MNLRRIARDKRAVLLPLLLLALANLAAYLLAVAPLRASVASGEQRRQAAANEVATATAQFEQARATVEGRGQASGRLDRFYRDVLPADQTAARRLTYFDLARMATSAGLRVTRRGQALEQEKGSSLRRLDTSMVLEGRYRNVREFLHEVEAAEEFVVINEIALASARDDSDDLVLTLSLSTYFQAPRER